MQYIKKSGRTVHPYLHKRPLKVRQITKKPLVTVPSSSFIRIRWRPSSPRRGSRCSCKPLASCIYLKFNQTSTCSLVQPGLRAFLAPPLMAEEQFQFKLQDRIYRQRQYTWRDRFYCCGWEILRTVLNVVLAGIDRSIGTGGMMTVMTTTLPAGSHGRLLSEREWRHGGCPIV